MSENKDSTENLGALRGSTGSDLISAERQRHKDQEGWYAAHDDKHRKGELVMAAVSYLLYSYAWGDHIRAKYVLWPWEPERWKPDIKDHTRNLVKAGALIAAEIDRLERTKR